MRKILEDLIFIGTLKETYKIFGKEWVLKTLTSEEKLQATSSTSDYDNVSRINALKLAFLSRSLCEIDGVELNEIKEKLEFLGNLQQPVVDMLYIKFDELQKKQDESLKEMEQNIKN